MVVYITTASGGGTGMEQSSAHAQDTSYHFNDRLQGKSKVNFERVVFDLDGSGVLVVLLENIHDKSLLVGTTERV